MSEPSKPAAPGTVKAFGIINIVLGAIFLLLTLWGLYAMMRTPAAGDNPIEQEMLEVQRLLMELPAVNIFTYAGLVVGLGLTALLIAGGVFLLQRHPLGRTLSLVFAVGSLVQGVFSAIYQFVVIQPHYVELLLGSGLEDSILQGMVIGARLQPVFTLLCSGIYPVILLIFVLPQRFADALEAPAAVERLEP